MCVPFRQRRSWREAMVALVLADAFLEKFGGDSVAEVRRNFESYLAHLRQRGFGER